MEKKKQSLAEILYADSIKQREEEEEEKKRENKKKKIDYLDCLVIG